MKKNILVVVFAFIGSLAFAQTQEKQVAKEKSQVTATKSEVRLKEVHHEQRSVEPVRVTKENTEANKVKAVEPEKHELKEIRQIEKVD